MNKSILFLAGDGIGPEIITEAEALLYDLKLPVTTHQALIGGAAIDAEGHPYPQRTQDLARQSSAILLGAVGGPKWDKAQIRPEAGLLAIRKDLDLYANIRPLKLFKALADLSPLKPAYVEDVDLIIVRELISDLYFGTPRGFRNDDGDEQGFNTMTYKQSEIKRITKVAISLAQQRKKHLCSIDKANVLEAMQLWRKVVDETSTAYPEIKVEHQYVDSMAMFLITKAKHYDIILCPNMFGDILSDEAAVLSGSLGLMPSASLGDRYALFEPIHGSAPDIAGQGIANPIGTILSLAMLLGHIGYIQEQKRIEQAVDQALEAGYRTQDIRQIGTTTVSTQIMGEIIRKFI